MKIISSSGLLLTAIFSVVSVAHAEGQQPSPFTLDLPDLGESLYLAQAESGSASDEAVQSEQCLAFASDPDADLGEVLKAGCEPTLAQMSALKLTNQDN